MLNLAKYSRRPWNELRLTELAEFQKKISIYLKKISALEDKQKIVVFLFTLQPNFPKMSGKW